MDKALKYRDAQLNRDPPSTPAGVARASGVWNRLPYLRENDGLLPPCAIAVGDRRRVHTGAKLLRDSLLLHEEVERLIGPAGRARVDMAIGIFEHDGKPLPVTIMETNVGCSAQEMYGFEGLLLSRHDGYSFDGVRISAKSTMLIRVGMCCGILMSDDGVIQKERPFLNRGDMILASSSMSDGVEVRQTLGLASSSELGALRRFWERWQYELRLGATEDQRWPVIETSRNVLDALSSACSQLGLGHQIGPNLTKNSRRLEQNSAELVALRRKYGVLSTDMDHFMLAFLAHELTMNGIPAAHGLISCVEKTVPAPDSQKNERPPEKNGLAVLEVEMMRAALLALWKIVYNGSDACRSATSIAP